MYKSVISLLSVLSMSNFGEAAKVCGNAQQSADNNIDVYLALDYGASTVTMTLSGPDGQYYGIGFGQVLMQDAYAIVIDGDGTVRERKLVSQMAGDVLDSTVTELANFVENGVRTVLLSRDLDVNDTDYYTFGTYDNTTSLDIMWATAPTVEISGHTAFGAANPITNFMVSDGTDASCGTLDSEGDFDTTMEPDMDPTMDYTYYCGTQEQDATTGISVSVAVSETTAYLTLQGPDGQYFGIGFGTTVMQDAYAIIVDGDGTITERKLVSQNSGTVLTASVTEISNEVEGDIRTVYLSRDLVGASDDYYTFTFDADDLNIIWGTADTIEISGHTSFGNTDPITNFMGSDGTDATCGNLATAGTDDDSAVSYGITVTFGLLLAVLPFLA